MADLPLTSVLGKVDAANHVRVEIPEWAGHGNGMLLAKTSVALLLLAFSSVFLALTVTNLPEKETVNSSEFATQATRASKAAAVARSDLREARQNFAESRSALERKDGVEGLPLRKRRTRLQELNQAVTDARREVRRNKREYERLALERSTALSDVVTVRATSDIDLVRVISLSTLSLVALVAAGALLAPRRSQLLTVAKGPASGTQGAAGIGAAGGPQQTSSGSGPGASQSSTPSEGAPPSSSGGTSSSFVAREPSVTQGLVATAVLIAGLFGIQNSEGAIESVINVAVAAVPIVGSLILRQRVAAKSSLTNGERARLFKA